MPISSSEKKRILGIAKVESLSSAGIAAVAAGADVSAVTQALLKLSQNTSDALVAELAMLAHAGISSAQLDTASALVASVHDRISSATNAFTLAARLAAEGNRSLVFPFLAGKASALLDLVQSMKTAVASVGQSGAEDEAAADELASALDNTIATIKDLRARVAALAG